MQLKDISGIGDKTIASLLRHNITTPLDLLTYYPRTYRTYHATTTSRAQMGDWVSLVGTMSRPVSRHGAHVTSQLATFYDASGNLTLRWFNSPFITRSVNPDSTYLVRGQLTVFGNTRQIVSPQIMAVREGHVTQDELVPIYTPVGTLKSGQLRKIIYSTLDAKMEILDPLPEAVRTKYQLTGLASALHAIHHPLDAEDLELAIKRLAFDELYLLQRESLSNAELAKVRTTPLHFDPGIITSFISNLPFTPTSAQQRVTSEILSDLQKSTAMHRLLAGEVGSGKTVVAATAALASFASGKRTLVMAPTQILAEQLSAAFTHLLGEQLTVSLITANQKGDIRSDVVVGTQALLSPKHDFASVGLVIIDEQHRFGVKQREYLSSLTPPPHVLTMTATPIPRTLAMTIFAGLDISRLDELPSSRLPIKTFLVGEEKRNSAYAWIKKEVESNHNQAFVVVPLIEEAEDEEGNAKKSLKLLEADLKNRFPHLSIDIMHGQMKEADKTTHLHAFRDGTTQILVATSMIEVGIDIPSANIMVIEDADRFGLSQLHQLRGRVGRGNAQGYCLLFSQAKNPKAKERLSYFVKERSGEKLASFDLQLRGPGELYGESQHGFFSLRFASISDTELLRQTYEAARISPI